MESLTEFQMICLEADNDYDQSSAGSGLSVSSGYYTRNESGKEPILSYVTATQGVGKVTLDGSNVPAENVPVASILIAVISPELASIFSPTTNPFFTRKSLLTAIQLFIT